MDGVPEPGTGKTDDALSPDDPLWAWAASAIRHRAEAMLKHVPGVREGADIEAVHDLRVGSRRLAAAMKVFAICFPGSEYRRLVREVRRVTRRLGALRDLDVLIDYYEKALRGRPMDWTCQAGSKCFYVAPSGEFHFCYHVPPQMSFEDVTRETLARNRGKKGCEDNCGVDCVPSTSLPYSNLTEVAGIEARDMLFQIRAQSKARAAAKEKARQAAISDPSSASPPSA